MAKKKRKEKSDLLIRDFKAVRMLAGELFLHGFRSVDRIEEVAISSSDYALQKKRLKAFLPSDIMRRKKGDNWYITYDKLYYTDNPLATLYRNRSFTEEDIFYYMAISAALHRAGSKGMNILQINNALWDYCEKVYFGDENLPSDKTSTQRNHLKRLEEEGLVIAQKEKQEFRYFSTRDIWEQFDENELLALSDCLEVIKNSMPLEMPYYFLQKKLALYLNVERGTTGTLRQKFLFTHASLVEVLDNDIMLELLLAIKEKRKVRIVQRVFWDELYLGNIEKMPREVLPVAIRHDCRSGAQYLVCYGYYAQNGERIKEEINLKNIMEVLEPIPDDSLQKKEALNGVYEGKGRWFCSAGRKQRTLVLELHLEEQKDQELIQRLRRQQNGGSLEKISKGIWRFTIEVSELWEFEEWLKTFGEKLGLKERKYFARDWERMQRQYEALWKSEQ